MNSYTAKSGWVHPTLIIDRIDSSFYKKEDIENLRRLFNSELPLKTLLDISNKITDGPHDGYTFVDNGVLFLRSQNIKNAGFDLSDKKFIEPEFHNKYRKSWLEQGDLLITRIGQYFGNSAVVSKDYVGCNINHAIAKVQLKKEVDPYYVCAYINSPTGNKLYRRLGKSFTSPRVNLADFSEFLVPLPARKIQTYIGNKIRKAEELREEAKRLKKEAEDILEKELGVNIVNVNQENTQKYTWVTCESIDDRIDAGFYSAKYKVLDAIKKKHEIIFMSEIINGIYTGNTPSSDYNSNDNDGVPLIAVNNVKPNLIEIADNIRKVALNDNLLLTEENDMVITRVGSVGVCAIIEEYEKGLAVSDNVIIVKLKERIPIRYLSFYLNSVTGVLQVERMVKGAVQPVINYQSINKFFIPILSSESMIAIDEKLKKYKLNLRNARRLIEEAKQDIEDLIEGKFDESKISEGV